jgi:hypothetical protein
MGGLLLAARARDRGRDRGWRPERAACLLLHSLPRPTHGSAIAKQRGAGDAAASSGDKQQQWRKR